MYSLFKSKTTATTSTINSQCRTDLAAALESGVERAHQRALKGIPGDLIYLTGIVSFKDKDSMKAYDLAHMELYDNDICKNQELLKYLGEFDLTIDSYDKTIEFFHTIHEGGVEILRNLLKAPSKAASLSSGPTCCLL